MARGLYLIDRNGTEYGFNEDMAKHTDLYAVMQDGKQVPWKGTPKITGGDTSAAMMTGDRFPTEQELLAARQLIARHENASSGSVAMAGLAAQQARQGQAAAPYLDPASRQAPSRDQDQVQVRPPTEAELDPGKQAASRDADQTPRHVGEGGSIADPVPVPEPPKRQPPESRAADLLSPQHSDNQDSNQDRHQAEAAGFQPDDWEGRERQEVPKYDPDQDQDPQAAGTAEAAQGRTPPPEDGSQPFAPEHGDERSSAPPPPPLPKRPPPPPKK